MRESFNSGTPGSKYGTNDSWGSREDQTKRRPSPSKVPVKDAREYKTALHAKDRFEVVSRQPGRIRQLAIAIVLLSAGVYTYQERAQVEEFLLKHTTEKVEPKKTGITEKIEKGGTDVELMHKLEGEVGIGVVGEMAILESVHSEEERQQALPHTSMVEATGFEASTIPAAAFEEVFKTLPLGFQNAKQVAQVAYEDKEIPMDPQYGIKNVEAAHVDQVTRKIVFSKGSNQSDARWVFETVFIHEDSHGNDYLTDTLLTLHERLELLSNLLDRVQSQNRFKSDYVESIHNSDKKKELELKVREYWAVIVPVYLSSDYFKLPQADRAIVADVIHKVDPTFDRTEALREREKIMAHFATATTGSVDPGPAKNPQINLQD